MPFTTVLPRKLASQLFLRDQNNMYENRQEGTLASGAASATYPVGRLVFRVIGTTDAAWTPVTNIGTECVITNEFAILAGDRTEIFADVVHTTGTASKIIYFSDRVTLDKASFRALNTVIATDNNMATVATLLQRQQIVFHERAADYTSPYEV
jgi:hypothetical protein